MSSTADCRVSTDRGELDLALIHRFLSRESYWARDVSRAVVERAVANSICFGLFEGLMERHDPDVYSCG